MNPARREDPSRELDTQAHLPEVVGCDRVVAERDRRELGSIAPHSRLDRAGSVEAFVHVFGSLRGDERERGETLAMRVGERVERRNLALGMDGRERHEIFARA